MSITLTLEDEINISHKDRYNLPGQKLKTFWMTGLSGSGKSTIAFAQEKES